MAIQKLLVALIALQHLAFLILEMFLWTHPLGLRVFRQSMEQAQKTAVLAANQGLYNGFLVSGLLWGLVHPDALFGLQIKMFFLTCVAVAGIYGGYSANKMIFWIQALPALISLIVIGSSAL